MTGEATLSSSTSDPWQKPRQLWHRLAVTPLPPTCLHFIFIFLTEGRSICSVLQVFYWPRELNTEQFEETQAKKHLHQIDKLKCFVFFYFKYCDCTIQYWSGKLVFSKMILQGKKSLFTFFSNTTEIKYHVSGVSGLVRRVHLFLENLFSVVFCANCCISLFCMFLDSVVFFYFAACSSSKKNCTFIVSLWRCSLHLLVVWLMCLCVLLSSS